MKSKAITYSAADEKILSQLQILKGFDLSKRDEFQKLPDLSISTIQKICSDEWKAPVSDFMGKINHNNWLDSNKKRFFLCACYYFSNIEINEIAKLLGCQRKTGYRSRDLIYYWIDWREDRSIVYLNAVKTLSQNCPGRLDNISKVDFSMIEGVDYDPKLPLPLQLNLGKISQIPIRDSSWFYNNNKQFTMIAYSLDGKEVRTIKFSRTSDHKLLYGLQCLGYRFISYDDYNFDEYLKKITIETDRLLAQSNELLNNLVTRKANADKPATPEKERSGLIGASKRVIKSFYKGESVSFLQCELILWQESEQYEICQALKEMIEKPAS